MAHPRHPPIELTHPGTVTWFGLLFINLFVFLVDLFVFFSLKISCIKISLFLPFFAAEKGEPGPPGSIGAKGAKGEYKVGEPGPDGPAGIKGKRLRPGSAP